MAEEEFHGPDPAKGQPSDDEPTAQELDRLDRKRGMSMLIAGLALAGVAILALLILRRFAFGFFALGVVFALFGWRYVRAVDRRRTDSRDD